MLREQGFKNRRRQEREPVRILLLEDDPRFAEILRAKLRAMQWVESRLEVAGTLSGALAKLAHGNFGLVVADLNLPDSSGLDTLEALARAGEQPIIVLTGDQDPGLRAAAIERGAYDFLLKDNLSAAALEQLVRLASIQANIFGSLRESEARFRNLVQLSSDWYWEMDAEMRHTAVKGTGLFEVEKELLGKTREELSGVDVGDPAWEPYREAVAARRAFRDFVYARSVASGGETRFVSLSGEPVFDLAGTFLGYRGVGKDITENVRRDEELRRFRLAMDNSADMIFLIDRASMRYIDVNDTACRLLGYSKDELLAMGPQDVLPVQRDELAQAYDELIAHRSDAGSMQSYYLCKDGSRLPFESTRHVLRSGESWIIAAISRDIRDRIALEGMRRQAEGAEAALLESETRFRQTFELAASGIAHVSLDGRFMRVNRKLCDILGYSEHELIGRSVKEISHPEDRDVTDGQRTRVRRNEVQSANFEKRYVRKDGSVVWVGLTVALARDARGEPQYEISVMEDITGRKQKEEELRRFRTALDGSGDMIFLVDARNSRMLDFNDTACRSLGYERAELLARTADAIVSVASRDALVATYGELMRSPARADSLVRTYRRKDGSEFQADVLRRVIDSPDGPILVINARDSTERKRAEERQAAHLRFQKKIAGFGRSALAKREPAELADDAVQCVLEGLREGAAAYIETDPASGDLVLRAVVGLAAKTHDFAAPARFGADDPLANVFLRGKRTMINATGTSAAPLPFGWAAAFRCASLVPVGGSERVRGALCALSENVDAFGEEENRFFVAAASVLSSALQRIDSEARLSYLAQFDPLTGLPNRGLLSDRFTLMISQARRQAKPLGVLFIDLDEFKLVNDTLGHAAGDELLKEAAQRLQLAVRAGDTVARISGDEFAVVLGDLARPDDAALVAQKVIERLATPFELSGQEIFVTASIGIAAFPQDGDSAEALLGAADAAMYRAKQSGRNTYQFFTADINLRTRARAQLGSELRRALEREEFRLVYQPKYELASGRVCGAEALLRWAHPERGVVPPVEFIPALEETGLIVAVGEWVLRRVCADLQAWQAAGLETVPVAVNLSARQFRQQDLGERIRDVIRSAGVDTRLIELEITESQLMQDPDHAIRVMHALSEAGIRIAIDDFGTGYSSLAYLTRFPLAALKIDRSFVEDALTDDADAAIVRTIIDMAHTLRFTVVAEGVETEAQAAFLRGLGCNQAQGYFFARPMPEADFRALISSAARKGSGKRRRASRYQ